jgi:hypothetical protein
MAAEERASLSREAVRAKASDGLLELDEPNPWRLSTSLKGCRWSVSCHRRNAIEEGARRPCVLSPKIGSVISVRTFSFLLELLESVT